MANDIVVTVPKNKWLCWLAEGDLPGDPAGEPASDQEWDFYLGGALPSVVDGDTRVYVVAHGYVRGYAPLLRLNGRHSTLVRGGKAVGCTTVTPDGQPGPYGGFRGFQYRARSLRERDVPREDWATFGLPPAVRREVEELLALRAKGPAQRKALQDLALHGDFGMAAARVVAGGGLWG